MARKNKVKTLTGIIITMGVVIALTGTTAVLMKQQSDENKAKYEAAQLRIDENTSSVYVALAKDEDGNSTVLKAGTVLEEGVNVEKVKVFTNLDDSFYISPDDFGRPLICDVVDGTPIYYNMVSHDTAEIGDREVEIGVAALMASQENYDTIDVRIMYPNGEDYTVLAKKQVLNLDMENSLFTTYLGEDEILRLDSAIVDAYTMSGAYIYTVKYTNSTISEETIPNYLVRSETLTLLQSDPNILREAKETMNATARANLETRLSGITEAHLEAVVSGSGMDDHADSSIILGEDVDMGSEWDSYDWTFESETTVETTSTNK